MVWDGCGHDNIRDEFYGQGHRHRSKVKDAKPVNGIKKCEYFEYEMHF